MNSLAHSEEAEKTTLDKHGLASVTLSVNWSDQRALHEEQLYVERFSVWREADTLPPEIGLSIPGMRAGEERRARLQPGELLDRWTASRVISTDSARFDRNHHPGLVVEPRVGRFYPQGFFQGVRGIFKDAVAPARITRLTQDRLELDTNAPLARFLLELRLRLEQVLPGYDRRGGRCTSPLDKLLGYPGLAAPLADGTATDYGDEAGGMSRLDERADELFYARPRLVQHLDRQALEIVNALYRRLLPAQAEVLDLMAGFDSHLQGAELAKLHLLGMNGEELAANAVATNRVVQDLNRSASIPYADRSLDAVVCTASIEYLLQPLDVLTEISRILRQGGLIIITFSNRWFPTKAVRVWSELHEFERVGMVTQWLQQAGFGELHTFSFRGRPRPADDPYANQAAYSDPVYAVWGCRAQ